MKKIFAAALALITAAALSACSQNTGSTQSTDGTQSSQTASAGNSESETGSLDEKQKDEQGDGEELYSFKAGDNEVRLILQREYSQDSEAYRGQFALKTVGGTEQLTTPMVSETGCAVSKTPSDSFQTEKINIGGKQYDLVIFKSDKSLEERLATCYVIDESGKITILANVFPIITGDITTDGEYIIFSDVEKYIVDIENGELVKSKGETLGEEIYGFNAGLHQIKVVMISGTGDDEGYTGTFALKTAGGSELLTTPMVSETGCTVSKTASDSFQTEKINIGGKQYDLVIFKSDKNLEERLATCYVIDESGKITILANVFPVITGDITTDGEYVVFSDVEKYNVDIENSALVKAE